MRYFSFLDGAIQKLFNFEYHPGFENLPYYSSKSHTGAQHLAVHPYYVHMPTSPVFYSAQLSQVCGEGVLIRLGPLIYISGPNLIYYGYR